MAWTPEEREFLVEKLLREYAQKMRVLAKQFRRRRQGRDDTSGTAVSLEGYASQADELADRVRRGGLAAIAEASAGGR